jgi:soluble lytic murein transglycosylase-like protein
MPSSPACHRVLGLALSVVLAATATASAAVQVSIRADGTKVISNENSDQRARRLSNVLVSAPDLDLDVLIEQHANHSRLDPKLVRAVIQVESGYNPKALSNKGAMGLMQLMPETARELAVTDPYDPGQNVGGGTSYLRQMLDLFKNSIELALAAYNSGPGAVQRHGGVPPYRETVAYVERVLGLYRGQAVSMASVLGVRVGRQVFLVRDGNNKLVLTTTPGATAHR